MTTAPQIECASGSDLSCPDACDDAAAESAAPANIRFAFARMVLAMLSKPEPVAEGEYGRLASAPQ
jgi:hypothetical protein